jgi:integrase/recombinase XerD
MGQLKIKKILTANEYSQKLQAIENNRDYVLFLLLWETGCRISEVLNIRVEHVNYDNRTIQIYSLKKKGESVRILPIDKETLRKVSMLIPATQKSGLIFDIQRMQAYNLSQKYLGVNPHAIRHSRAIDLITHGTNVEIVRRLLGHTRLDVTQIYLDFDFETMRTELDKVHLMIPNKESTL